ncbi:MAG TPA: hypothetical protein VK787_01725 [Puia sp.]|jgi:hypothetical protein|nr:hypothetical protein [Puia sp.]
MMKEQEVYDDFEVSFNFKNVLFICQVKLIKEPINGWYYNVNYFSPNEKGTIEHLIATTPEKSEDEETVWSDNTNEHELDFLQTLGREIEKHEM